MNNIIRNKGVVYYTDFHADPKILRVCLEQLKKNFDGEVVSVSLKKPLDFGKNIVLEADRGYITMVRQIILGLENLTTDCVFFTENDVLYNKSHFDFIPPKDNIFYYNANTWRWYFGDELAVTYDRMLSLSCLCVNREFALKHYKMRIKKIEEVGLDKFKSREPDLARKWGYEPGTKKKKRGGLTDDDFEIWHSEYPVIDIRHQGTFSPPKVTLDSFKHPPKNWREISIEEIPGWNLKNIFGL